MSIFNFFNRNEKPVIVKFIDGTYGVRKKVNDGYRFLDVTGEYWWREEKRFKYCRFETLESVKIMSDLGEIVDKTKVESNGKCGYDVFRCSEEGKGGTPDFYLYGHKIVQKDGDGKGGN